MNLKPLPEAFTVCQISNFTAIDFSREYVFLSKTDEELSLVCETEFVPAGAIAREDGWRAFRVGGVLDFSLVGILAEISGTLAKAGISIFAISTYNTDYILVKEASFPRALAALSAARYANLE